ncbi:MAG: hypothetical protein NVS3B21_05870 [Acidimicrobiales bacterium]
MAPDARVPGAAPSGPTEYLQAYMRVKMTCARIGRGTPATPGGAAGRAPLGHSATMPAMVTARHAPTASANARVTVRGVSAPAEPEPLWECTLAAWSGQRAGRCTVRNTMGIAA